MSVANLVSAAASVAGLGAIETVKIGDIIVSALVGLEGSDAVTITERPVEAGYSVVEAAVATPVVRTLDLVFTDPDLSIEAGLAAATTGSLDQLTQTWRDKKQALYDLFAARELVVLVTHENVYPDMMIESIAPKYDVDGNWDAFQARVTLRQIDIRQTASAGGTKSAITSAAKQVGAS